MDPLDILRSEIERLQNSNSQLTSERDEYRNALEAVGAERDDLAGQISSPDEMRDTIQQLRGQLRDRDHRSVFDRQMTAAGANPKYLDRLWKFSEYRAETDQADEAAMAELVNRMRESDDYAFSQGSPTSPAAPGRPIPGAAGNPPRPVPGAGRGGRIPTEEMRLTKEQLADPKFMLNPANKAFIKAHTAPCGPMAVAS